MRRQEMMEPIKDGYAELSRAIILDALSASGDGDGESLAWLLDPDNQDFFVFAGVDREEIRGFVREGARFVIDKNGEFRRKKNRVDGPLLLFLYDLTNAIKERHALFRYVSPTPR